MKGISVMRIKCCLYLVIFALTYTSNVIANPTKFAAPLFNDLGSFHHEISTKVTSAQRFFDQGLVLFYAFEWGESIRSFKEATRLDPHCGMCYWGLALAITSKINAPKTGHEYIDAKTAIEKGLSLSAVAPQKEQDYIKALALLFQHKPQLTAATGAFSCHSASIEGDESTTQEKAAYADAMKKITLKYPTDPDAKALYIYALFNKISWHLWDKNGKMNPTTLAIIELSKSMLATDPLNIAANHYYIHVLEPSPYPQNALESADRLRTLVPGSEHLVHMPTHIYFLTGRYHQGTESSLQAIQTYQQYNHACYAQGFAPEINYLYLHNYDFLRTTAVMEGRQKLALSATEQMMKEPFPSWLANEPSLQWFIPIPYYVKLRFGLWHDVLKEPMPKATYQYALGMWYYAQGMALSHTGAIKNAELNAKKLQQLIHKGSTINNLDQDGVDLLTMANEILMGTIADHLHNEKSAIAHLKRADKIQQDMGYHEPPDWYFPVKEMLGDVYLKWNHPQEAIAMYKEDLKQYPQNGWALYGWSQALRKMGNIKQAEEIATAFKAAWKYADTPTPLQIN